MTSRASLGVVTGRNRGVVLVDDVAGLARSGDGQEPRGGGVGCGGRGGVEVPVEGVAVDEAVEEPPERHQVELLSRDAQPVEFLEVGADVAGGEGRSPSSEAIAFHAYYLWLAQGQPVGTDWDDWREAERQLAASA